MEFLLEFLLWFLLEIFGEILVALPLHAFARFIRDRPVFLNGITCIGFGLIIGLLSIWIFPQAFVRSTTVHGISLLITPVLAGLTMAAVGYIRRRKGKSVVYLESFSYGFLFAFTMALIRFIFTR